MSGDMDFRFPNFNIHHLPTAGWFDISGRKITGLDARLELRLTIHSNWQKLTTEWKVSFMLSVIPPTYWD